MATGIVSVNLHHIQIFDCGFAIFALLKILFSAIGISLLPDVRVTSATEQQTCSGQRKRKRLPANRPFQLTPLGPAIVLPRTLHKHKSAIREPNKAHQRAVMYMTINHVQTPAPPARCGSRLSISSRGKRCPRKGESFSLGGYLRAACPWRFALAGSCSISAERFSICLARFRESPHPKSI